MGIPNSDREKDKTRVVSVSTRGILGLTLMFVALMSSVVLYFSSFFQPQRLQVIFVVALVCSSLSMLCGVKANLEALQALGEGDIALTGIQICFVLIGLVGFALLLSWAAV